MINGSGTEWNEFSIESFWTKDLPIKLLKPLSLKVFYEDGRYIVEEGVFNIYAVNQDFQKACLDFENHICHLYEEFVQEDIKKLGDSGISLRKLLQSYIMPQ